MNFDLIIVGAGPAGIFTALEMLRNQSKAKILLIEKGIKNKSDLIPLAGISTNVLAKMNKGEYVSMESLHKICRALKCDIGDIVTFEEK